MTPPGRTIESRELATALKGVKGAVRDKIKRNMSERAAIMGYSSYAAFGLAEETAKNPEAVNAMLEKRPPSFTGR